MSEQIDISRRSLGNSHESTLKLRRNLCKNYFLDQSNFSADEMRQALSDLRPMRSVALRVASDDRVQFEVDFAGGRSQLIRSVTGVGGLSECEEPAAESPTFCFR